MDGISTLGGDQIQLEILLFASCKEALGGLSKIKVSLRKGKQSVTWLRSVLLELYPTLIQVMPSCRIAVSHNLIPIEEEDTHILYATDEIALIPPVSGG